MREVYQHSVTALSTAMDLASGAISVIEALSPVIGAVAGAIITYKGAVML